MASQTDLRDDTFTQKVNQNLGMVGKGPKDADSMSALVRQKLVGMGKLKEDAAVQSDFIDSDEFWDVAENFVAEMGYAEGMVNILQSRLRSRGFYQGEINRRCQTFTPQHWAAINQKYGKYFTVTSDDGLVSIYLAA